MTISTVLSLQHSSSIQLGSESTDISDLTELAGYFQATLEQQIIVSGINPQPVTAAQLVDAEQGLTHTGGDQLPATGTTLPVAQALASNAEGLHSNMQIIAPGEKRSDVLENGLSFRRSGIEQALSSVRQKLATQHSLQGATSEAAITDPDGSTPDRSAPVQYAAISRSTAGHFADLQATVKLADHGGRLFDSVLPNRELPVMQSAGTAANPAVSITVNGLHESIARARAMALNIPHDLQKSATPPDTDAASIQNSAKFAELHRQFDLKSFNVVSGVRPSLVQNNQIDQYGATSNSTAISQQGISLSSRLLATSDPVADQVIVRPQLENAVLVQQTAAKDQRISYAAIPDRPAVGSVASTIKLAQVNQTGGDVLAQSKPSEGITLWADELTKPVTDSKSNITHPANSNLISGKSAAISVAAAEPLVLDQVSVLNRQALNADTFRSTIKTALDRGLGRHQDNTLRTEQNLISDARPVDGDNGRTIVLPSLSGPQAATALASNSAALASGHMPGTIATQNEAAAQLGQRIQWMINSNARRADIQIDPPELGSVQIQVAQEERQTTVSFVTQNASARELIEQSLPRLKEHLENLGIELADANVEQQSAGHTEQDQENSSADASLAGDDRILGEAQSGTPDERSDEHRNGGIDAYA